MNSKYYEVGSIQYAVSSGQRTNQEPGTINQELNLELKMARHNQLGKKGEEIAARYLEGIGYDIIKRNWRHDKDEIDIIARDGKQLVIVEVKTRSTSFFGEPEDSVDRKKQQFLIRAAEAYVMEKDLFMEIRYDIVSIIIDNNKKTVRHIKDAFYPEIGTID